MNMKEGFSLITENEVASNRSMMSVSSYHHPTVDVQVGDDIA
jgi:hypothetical protein